ncbi:uncharacterized protein CC84DRAFT_1213956 [Paraphaeosphaeria sporulosa]|uniref:Uncharacterized protein n=1 Tax=Paraphaeosphaeria sporulosa TaxID=1460663 RepID=A0A177CV74_9PLEO|nr:uncharacterized protein CC84DRAFT_1213956 [Paraphaeosphaeria sporulosa]OAG10649.1 hypothetical protein CC84DRAFT_1213956 [Paraphaeosphaeria sporulosa]
MHLKIKNAFNTLPEELHASHNLDFPDINVWVDTHSGHFWIKHRSKFPVTGIPVPNYGLVSERIYPLSPLVRSVVVDARCPKEIQKHKAEFLARPDNKNCLLRIYLGRHSRDTPMAARNARLRDFPLHLDEMECLKLDVKMFAYTAAQYYKTDFFMITTMPEAFINWVVEEGKKRSAGGCLDRWIAFPD